MIAIKFIRTDIFSFLCSCKLSLKYALNWPHPARVTRLQTKKEEERKTEGHFIEGPMIMFRLCHSGPNSQNIEDVPVQGAERSMKSRSKREQIGYMRFLQTQNLNLRTICVFLCSVYSSQCTDCAFQPKVTRHQMKMTTAWYNNNNYDNLYGAVTRP